MPFVINRLPEPYRKSLIGAVMLSPSTASDFEIHVSDMVTHDKAGSYPTQPEVNAIHTLPMLCVQGRMTTRRYGYVPVCNSPT